MQDDQINEQINDDTIEQGAVEAPAKTFTQDDVNRIVGGAKADVERRVKARSEQEYQQKLQEIQSQHTNNQVQGEQQLSADAMYQKIQEKFNQDMQQRQQDAVASTAANNYLSKMQQGRDSYDDFEEITKDFDPTQFPQLIYLVSGIDNASDVIYELSKNPMKLVALDSLAEKSPAQAQRELMKLATSISTNKNAQAEANQGQINDPLNRLQPSRITSDNSKLSIRDLRNQPWLRG